MEKLERRVEELEMRLSFQEDTLRQLDEVIRGQADRIEDLGGQLTALRVQVSQNPGQAANLEEDKPPHY